MKNDRTTRGLAKCGLDIMQHQLLFCYCAAVVRATELYSTKNFILNFKPAYRQAGKKSTTVRADGMLLSAIRQALKR